MAILNLVKYPDEFLYKKSKQVVDFDVRLHELLDDMLETMQANNGMGLAAVQIGRLVRACIVMTRDGLVELINPEIIAAKGTYDCDEACLSRPGESYMIRRANKIRVGAQDRHGNWHKYDFKGIEAVCVQHEMDHLDGILIGGDE